MASGLVGVADDGVPVGDGQLTGDERRGALGAVLDDLGEIKSFRSATRAKRLWKSPDAPYRGGGSGGDADGAGSPRSVRARGGAPQGAGASILYRTWVAITAS